MSELKSLLDRLGELWKETTPGVWPNSARPLIGAKTISESNANAEWTAAIHNAFPQIVEGVTALLEWDTARDKLLSEYFDREQFNCLEGCDSFGHEDLCPVTNPMEAYYELLRRNTTLREGVEELERKVRIEDGYRQQYQKSWMEAIDELKNLERELSALREQDEIHWKTRKTLVEENAALSEANERFIQLKEDFNAVVEERNDLAERVQKLEGNCEVLGRHVCGSNEGAGR